MSDIQKKITWGGGVLALIIVICCFMQGCQQFGTVSPKAYEVAIALYSTCNRKDNSRLATVEQLVTQSVQAGELTATEEAWFRDMIATARAGEWETAMMNARTMMSEQVEH